MCFAFIVQVHAGVKLVAALFWCPDAAPWLFLRCFCCFFGGLFFLVRLVLQQTCLGPSEPETSNPPLSQVKCLGPVPGLELPEPLCRCPELLGSCARALQGHVLKGSFLPQFPLGFRSVATFLALCVVVSLGFRRGTWGAKRLSLALGDGLAVLSSGCSAESTRAWTKTSTARSTDKDFGSPKLETRKQTKHNLCLKSKNAAESVPFTPRLAFQGASAPKRASVPGDGSKLHRLVSLKVFLKSLNLRGLQEQQNP